MTSKLFIKLGSGFMRCQWNVLHNFHAKHWWPVCSVKAHGNVLDCCQQYHLPAHSQHSNTYEKLQEYLKHKDLSDIYIRAQETGVQQEKTPEEILAELSPDEEKKLKILKLEHQMLFERNPYRVPEIVSDRMWVELLKLNTASARQKKYIYFSSVQQAKISKKLKQQKKQEERLQTLAVMTESEQKEAKYTIFLHIMESTMNKFNTSKIMKSMEYGPHIVFDMGFEHLMQKKESINAVLQILMSHNANKNSKEPFHIAFTNMAPEGILIDQFTNYHPLYKYYTMTEKSYLDLFPKEKLVYLTPDAPMELKSFSYDDVYIIGGIVDKSCNGKFSLAKAKENGLRMAKFPLDKYLRWSVGTKSLTIDQAFNIMLKLKETNNWKESLQFVPKRKLVDPSKEPEVIIPKKKLWKRQHIKLSEISKL